MGKHKDNLALAAEFMRAAAMPVSRGFLETGIGVQRVRAAWLKFDEAFGYLTLFEGQDLCVEPLILEAVRSMADLTYALYQFSAYLGLDLDCAVRALHKSSMSKLGKDSKDNKDDKPLKGMKGARAKSPGYTGPDLREVVRSVPVSL